MSRFFVASYLAILIGLVTSYQSIQAIIFDTLTGPDKTITVTWSPTFTDGGYARGNVTFCNGFTLPPSGNMSIGVTEPVRGTIDLNNGNLRLTKDLQATGASFTLTGTGNLYLNNYSLEIENQVTIDNGPKQIVTPGTIGGKIGRVPLCFTNGGAIRYDLFNATNGNGTDTHWKNIKILNARDDTFSIAGLNGVGIIHGIVLDNVAFYLRRGVSFIPLIAVMYIDGPVEVFGPGSVFWRGWTGGQAFTFFRKFGSLRFNPDVTFLTAGLEASFESNFNEIVFDNCTWERAFGTLAPLTKGRMVFNGLVTLIALTQLGVSSLVFGDGANPANDFDLVFLQGARLVVENGNEIIYQNVK